MAIAWKHGFDPSLVIDRMETTREVAEDGRVHFRGFEHEEYRSILYGMTDFPEDVPEVERRRIVGRGIFAAAESGPLTSRSLMSAFGRLLQEFYRRPSQRFALYTTLSIRNLGNPIREHFGRDQLIIDNKPHLNFQVESKKIADRAIEMSFGKLPKFYQQARIHVTARTESEAADLALNHLELARGIWNLRLNLAHQFRMSFGGKPKPVNQIITGPIHTLHFPDGRLAAEERWWYEPTFLEPVQRLDFRSHRDKLLPFTAKVRERISQIRYSAALEEAIRRYCGALDERNWNSAFLRLWSVLELLTATAKQRYDVTIRRASYLYQDRDYHVQLLSQLREFRNSSVHEDAQTPEIEAYLYQLKNVVEGLLQFHLFNSFGFDSLEDAGSFLQLPADDKALRKRRDIAGFALRYRGHE